MGSGQAGAGMNELAARALVYVLVAVIALGTGWKVRGWKEDSDAAIRMAAKQTMEDMAKEVVSEVADKTAKAVAGIKVTNTTIYQKTRHEIIKEPMDSGCRLPAGWMRNINKARSGVDRSEPAAAVH